MKEITLYFLLLLVSEAEPPYLTYKGYDAVFPLLDCAESLIADPLIEGELIIITKVVYHEHESAFYVEFLRDSQLYYTYFYEQIVAYDFNEKGNIIEVEHRFADFDFPWVLCER